MKFYYLTFLFLLFCQNCKLVMCTKYNSSLFQNPLSIPKKGFSRMMKPSHSKASAAEWIQKKTSDGAQSFGHLQCGSIVKSKCIFHLLLPLLLVYGPEKKSHFYETREQRYSVIFDGTKPNFLIIFFFRVC